MEEQNQYYDLSDTELYNELRKIEDKGNELRDLLEEKK